MRLKGKVALITGGGGGIGRATARRFQEEGARVSICDLDAEAGRKTAKDLGGGCRFSNLDVTDKEAVGAWVEETAARWGRIDVLINNAGILRDKFLVKLKEGRLVNQMSEAEFDLVLAVNLKGVFNCAQAVAPIMIAQQGGVILNATSIVGLDGNLGQTNYVASKAGVVGMTKVWARELGPHGIRVNAVAPGFTATGMVKAMPVEILQRMTKRVPLGRMGAPTEIAAAYLFLASDEASYVSGVTLRVDGGIVIGT